MRAQIRARVEHEEWEALKRGGESNTELLARILQEWQAQKAVLSSLAEIDPSPPQALGRLLLSHELLQKATISIRPPEAIAVQPSLPTIEANPAPIVGGLENNSDDW